MIRKLFAIALIAGLFASCAGNAEKGETNNDNLSDEASAQPEIPVVTIANFSTEAGKYVGKEIQIEGIVDHICKHGGKRLLLVSDDGDVHVDAEERFDEEIEGSEIIVTGTIDEFRVDEAYCLKQEEDNIESHNLGETDNEHFESEQQQIQFYRDSMQTAGIDHISYYSIIYVSHKAKE